VSGSRGANPTCNVSSSGNKKTLTMPDLMSFQDAPVTNVNNKDSWINLEASDDLSQNEANSAYNKSIKNVLSLYNTTNTTTQTVSSVPLNQQKSYYPPLGTFSTTNYNWQNDMSRNRVMSLPHQTYQSFQSQGDNTQATSQQFPMHFPTQPFAAGSSTYNKGTTIYQQPLNISATEPVSTMPHSLQQNSVVAGSFNTTSINYGNSNATLQTNCNFPRPSSLGELKEFQQEKLMTQRSPLHSAHAFNHRKSLKVGASSPTPSQEHGKKFVNHITFKKFLCTLLYYYLE